MSKANPTEKSSPAKSPSPSKAPQQSKPPKATTKTASSTSLSSLFLILLFGLMVAILVTIVWTRQHLSSQQQTLNNSLTTLSQSYRTDLNRWQTVAEDTVANHEQLQIQKRLQQDNALSLQRLQKFSGHQDNTWILEEVRYLVRMAHYSATLSHDSSAAISLLQTADARLRGLSDPAYTRAREAFAEDIAALRAVAKTDVEGIFLKLQAISQSVSSLPLAVSDLATRPATPSQQSMTNHELPQWQQGLQQAWQTIKQFVIIRHHDKNPAPLLSPQQRTYLVANVQQQLSDAQWALLNRQQGIYQTSLTQAQQWLRDYFAHTVQADSMLQQLNNLQQLNVAPRLPSLSASANALQQKPNFTAPVKEHPAVQPKASQQQKAATPGVLL